MGAWDIAEVVAIVLCALVILPVLALFARRRWLARQGGMFECGLRLHDTTPGTGWVLGVARYRAECLEWFRVFSLSLTPRVTLRRPVTSALGTREPGEVEAMLLYDGQKIVSLKSRDEPHRAVELAMSGDSVTGLLSWLEAAPPGISATETR